MQDLPQASRSHPGDAERIARRLRDYLKGALPGLEREIEALDTQKPLWDVIGSFSLLELADYVERAFEVEIAPLDFVPENFSSLERIAAYVLRRHGPP